MATFHLRPLSAQPPSPPPRVLATPQPPPSPPLRSKPPPTSPPPSGTAMVHTRRPLSPSSLRDVNLTPDTEKRPREYPAPPTGHDLMAMFPPKQPATEFIDLSKPSTSGFFRRQERAFFAQAGKEILRVHVEIDVPQDVDMESGRGKGKDTEANTTLRPWSQSGHTTSPPPPNSHPSHRTPFQSSATAHSLPKPPSHRPPHRGGPIPVTPTTIYPTQSHAHTAHPPPAQHPPNRHHGGPGVHSPPLEPPGRPSRSGSSTAKSESQPDEYMDDPDEAWRRPMPYAERRRAGKHTKRVIVR